MFIKQVAEQLNRMSEAEKEEWILSQARLLAEREQQDFLKSLSGEKKIIYMPSQREIEEFCEKVESGEIYLEYERHYYEFDDDGRYMDNWKVWHNDPSGAMPFLNRTFKGCHDLLILNEYKTVVDILDRVCRLEFKVVEAADSEDLQEDSPFTVADADREGMLSVNISDVGIDWVTSYVQNLKSFLPLQGYWRNPDIMRKKRHIYTINMEGMTNMFLIWKRIWKRKVKHM